MQNSLKSRTICRAALFFVCCFSIALTAAPLRATAEGCCEKIAEGKTPCSDPSCVAACFSMPTIEACKQLDQKFYWNSGKCWGLPECSLRAATGCCLTSSKCYAGFSDAQCRVIGGAEATYSNKRCSEGENRTKCADKLEDPSLAAAASDQSADTATQVTAPAKIPKFVIPSLTVKIPGLASFAEPGGGYEAGYYEVPYVGQYISAVYAWATGIVSILAIAMIAWGGFKWTTAGGDQSKVSSAKTTITNALLGLLLALGTYTILWTLNPELVNFKNLRIDVIKRITYGDATEYMAGSKEAASTLSEIGVQPGGGSIQLKHKIPSSCASRDPSVNTGPLKLGGVYVYPKSRLAFCPAGKSDCLTQQIIDKYLEEQNKTGVPAAVLMAQMLTESWNKCVLLNLFNDPKRCGGIAAQSLNFGGIGCTATQVPKDTCPHVAFTQGGFNVKTKEKVSLPCSTFNKYSQKCVEICEQAGGGWQSARSNPSYNCGDCSPWPSQASTIVGGQEIWMPSIQCSKKFSTVDAFLKYHLGFVKPCLPYNDSVYKFAYCIGASTYAGVTGSKGLMLAEIIERNCLCDPETDSTKCQRNQEIEEKLANNVIKKRNLFLLYKEGKPDYNAIVKALAETSGGLLTPTQGERLPQNDIIPPPDF